MPQKTPGGVLPNFDPWLNCLWFCNDLIVWLIVALVAA
jgi:hypothetical protein